jgi:hypothetical protein
MIYCKEHVLMTSTLEQHKEYVSLTSVIGITIIYSHSTVGRKKKAPVRKSETLFFLITRGILNEFFADFFA